MDWKQCNCRFNFCYRTKYISSSNEIATSYSDFSSLYQYSYYFLTAGLIALIIGHIKNVAAIANGVTDLSQLTQEQLQAILTEATAATVISLTLTLEDGVVTFYDTANSIVAQFSLSGNEVKQTGSSYIY